METVGYVALRGQAYHLLHHVAAAGHHKLHVVHLVQHLRCSLDEIFRTLLHGDAPEEGDHLVVLWRNLYVEQLVAQRLNGIVHGGDLGRVDAILVDHCIAGEVAHRDDVVGVKETVTLDIEHGGVYVTAAAVEIGGMDMEHKWLAGDLLGMDAGRICKPVVRVDHVTLHGSRDHARHNRIIIDFLKQIVGITA